MRAIRNTRTEKKVQAGKRLPATIAAGSKLAIFQAQERTLSALAYIEAGQLTLVESLPEKPQGQTGLVVAGVEVYLPLADLVDAEAERARLQKELDDTLAQIERLDTLLSGSFGQRAPAAVVEKERQKLAAFQETAARLKEQLANR